MNDSLSPAAEADTPGAESTEQPDKDTLQAFFSGLMNRGAASASPRPTK